MAHRYGGFDWQSLLLGLALYGGAAVIICAVGWSFTSWQCSSKAEVMGLPSSWGPIQGCMIQVDKRWIPIESYRTIGGVE